MKKQICIVGTGYVGMASAIGLAELGHSVRGYDILEDRIEKLQRGITPYKEDAIEQPLNRHLATGRLSFHASLYDAVKDANFIIVCVGTPSSSNGSCDLSYLHASIESLKTLAPPEAIIVVRSTVPTGTTRDISQKIAPLRVIYAPEFLREGHALADFLEPDRIVVGSTDRRAALEYLDLFASLKKPTFVTSFNDAELIKACSNAYLALKISFANEVANLCDVLDADALAVLEGIGADNRIGPRFLQPGIGFGGPCFEKDVKSLRSIARYLNIPCDLLDATLKVNGRQPFRVIKALEEEIGSLAGRSIGVWGLSFKAGTDDTRDSIAVEIVSELMRRGADLIVYDPMVDIKSLNLGCRVAESAMAAVNADALLVLTEWPEFRAVDPLEVGKYLKESVVVDGRNVLDHESFSAAGVTYRGIGRRGVSEPKSKVRTARISSRIRLHNPEPAVSH